MDGGTVSIGTSFVAGVLSFLSPCVLPLVPGYLTYMAGVSLEELEDGLTRQQLLKDVTANAATFVLGFSVIFILMGAGASAAGQWIRQNVPILVQIGGVVVILMGLHLAKWLPIPILYREKRYHPAGHASGFIRSFVLGITFAVGWTPCIGPILGGILALASTRDTITDGVIMLTVYSFGLGIPFMLTAIATGSFFGFYKRVRKHIQTFERVSGVLLIIIGILMATNNMGWLASKLAFFPELAQ